VNLTIIGTGMMGRGIAARALAGGHHVTFVGTHLSKARGLADEFEGEGEVDAAEEVTGDLVVLAVPYTEATHVVRQHAEALPGKVIVDATNPVDIGAMEPLSDVVGSGAETIAAAAPDGVPVVKAFNTAFAGTLLSGTVGGEALDIFIATDDDDARRAVAQLVRDGGMRPIDAGELRRSAELEALGYLHMRIQHNFDLQFASAVKILTP
jgi:predicted dinucleotide-binding enzyme